MFTDARECAGVTVRFSKYRFHPDIETICSHYLKERSGVFSPGRFASGHYLLRTA